MLFPFAASADTYTYTGGSGGDWTDTSRWTDSQGNSGIDFPDADDRAIVPNNKTVFIRAGLTITVDTIWIKDTGKIKVEGSGVLILENDDVNCDGVGPNPTCATVDNSRIDGALELNGDGTGNVGRLRFMVADHVVGGNGRIDSLFEVGQIRIYPNVIMTNQLDHTTDGIVGTLDIIVEVDGLFVNEGIVHATTLDPDFAELFVTGDITDIPGAIWMADCDATLIFATTADLYGNIVDGLSSGNFEFRGDISTCGKYIRTGCGCLRGFDVSLTTFRYAVFDDGGSGCQNPGAILAPPLPCPSRPLGQTGFIVNSDSDSDPCDGCEGP